MRQKWRPTAALSKYCQNCAAYYFRGSNKATLAEKSCAKAGCWHCIRRNLAIWNETVDFRPGNSACVVLRTFQRSASVKIEHALLLKSHKIFCSHFSFTSSSIICCLGSRLWGEKKTNGNEFQKVQQHLSGDNVFSGAPWILCFVLRSKRSWKCWNASITWTLKLAYLKEHLRPLKCY